MLIIETNNLTKTFGERTAVKDLTLQVEKGEVLGFLGPNGAGKTTTIRMLAGMIAPSSGSATVAGLNVIKEAEKVHERIGLLTEIPGFYGRLTARRNLEFYAGFYPSLNVPAAIEKYLKRMGLYERRLDKVGTFSKGMKQRLALARAMLHEPEILFLDEPTSGLDPEAAAEVRNIILDLRSEGRTIFLSTHNLNEAEQLCRRIAVINTSLLALDTPENLRRRFFRRQIIVRLAAEDNKVVEFLRRLSYVENLQSDGRQLTLELADPEHDRPALVKAIVEAGGAVEAVTEKQYPLEDVYLKLVREKE